MRLWRALCNECELVVASVGGSIGDEDLMIKLGEHIAETGHSVTVEEAYAVKLLTEETDWRAIGTYPLPADREHMLREQQADIDVVARMSPKEFRDSWGIAMGTSSGA